jgi:SNF2 family DNA or RNA helicase
MIMGEKALIFTSFLDMADIIHEIIIGHFNIYCRKIDGRTIVSERQRILDEFKDVKDGLLIILNPKAAGSGLNIHCGKSCNTL